MPKLRVGILFGGASGEHEISLQSTCSIVGALDKEKYQIVPIGINKKGQWYFAEEELAVMLSGELPRLRSSVDAADVLRIRLDGCSGLNVDIVLPVLHGPYGEDGTVQGLLELLDLPYVGAGVAGSAVGLDKELMRQVFTAAGLPLLPWRSLRLYDWQQGRQGQILEAIARELGYPCFVKPANMGSSVGISKAYDQDQLRLAILQAGQYDRKIIIEQAAQDAREIECSVLGNEPVRVSLPGEIIPSQEFYDYRAKYQDNTSQLIAPAVLEPEVIDLVQDYAIKAFQAIDCAGMARVDFFLTGKGLYVNEINTIPGFTKISMYPKLWQSLGMAYSDLLDQLIQLGFERYNRRKGMQRSKQEQ